MTTLSELLAEHTELPGAVVDHLQRVVAEWQLLADMSFADFLLWIPLPAEPGTYLCVAQARPTTASTAHPEDMVGAKVGTDDNPLLHRAVVEGRICRDENPRWHLEVPVRSEAIPVRLNGEVVAVLSRDTNLAMPRVPSPLEIAYLGSASDLCQMVADGTFPPKISEAGTNTSPRAGDGLIRLDALGLVAYASPNALSAYHRMGHASDLVGMSLLRELGPLLVGVVVIGRSGSAVTAELGTMKVSEEIEALEVMAINPIRFLVVPRFLAMLVMLPALTVFGNYIGMTGGWAICRFSLDMPTEGYIRRLIESSHAMDLYSGMIKSVVFAWLIITISCFYGLKVKGGAEGVGRATTQSVVVSILTMLIADALLTAIFFVIET